jgi:tRNA threonylcarbamoyladenosine biosynthesis protein TsaB
MLVLGVDTATAAASVALVRDGEPVALESCPVASGHGETLLPLVTALFDRVGELLTAIDGIGVSLGPGSFSGLRVGLSTVKGLAYALGCQVAGIPTLDALAQLVTAWDGLICPLLDARNGEVYAALFRRGADGQQERLTQDLLLTPEALCRQVTAPCALIGDALERYGTTIQASCRARAPVFLLASRPLLGEVIAKLAWERFVRGDADDLYTLEPAYVRPPDARLPQATQKGLKNLP